MAGMAGSSDDAGAGGAGLFGSLYVLTMQPTGCGRSNGYMMVVRRGCGGEGGGRQKAWCEGTTFEGQERRLERGLDRRLE
jgi:hypothetical protein